MRSKASKITVVFDTHEKSRKLVLKAFGKGIGNDNMVVEANNTAQRVLTPRGDEIPLDEFAGVVHGSTVFVKSDIDSVLEIVDRLKTKRR